MTADVPEAGSEIATSTNDVAPPLPVLEPAPEPTADETLALLRQLGGELEQLRAAFDDKIKYDAGREKIIDQLHAELQEYKADLLLKVMKPLVLDLINFHDGIGKTVAAHKDGAPEPGLAAKLLARLVDFQADLEDILYRSGFESFTVEQAEFDPKRQRIVRSVPTEDSQLDRKIAERLRKGFVYEGRVIRPELVAVYIYQAKA